MMSRIDRIKDTISMRRAARIAADRVGEARAQASTNLPVPVAPVVRVTRSFRDERPGGDSEFAAQLMGQDGQRRGLRAGPSIHDAARVAYARAEYSGSYDRRARAGQVARKLV